jgi:hypothetical protein
MNSVQVYVVHDDSDTHGNREALRAGSIQSVIALLQNQGNTQNHENTPQPPQPAQTYESNKEIYC